jgi:hypothetical protein
MEKNGILVHQGVPKEEWLAKIPKPFILVLDDLICEIDQNRLESIFVKNSHHQQFCVIFLTQSLFNKKMSVPRRNSHFIFLMRQPNDMLSVKSLSTQLFPREAAYFQEAYKRATEKPYSYLLIDMFPNRSNQNLRLRSCIFEGDCHEVYLPKNG